MYCKTRPKTANYVFSLPNQQNPVHCKTNKQTNKSRYYFALTKLAKLTKSDLQYYFIVTYTARSSHATTLRSPRYNASKHNPLTGYASACASKNTKHTRKHVEHFNQIESCYVIHDAKSWKVMSFHAKCHVVDFFELAVCPNLLPLLVNGHRFSSGTWGFQSIRVPHGSSTLFSIHPALRDFQPETPMNHHPSPFFSSITTINQYYPLVN